MSTPFSKKPNFKAGVVNELQIEKDDIDDETMKMLDQKSVDQLLNENEIITQEINKLNQEFLDINEKSNSIEALLKSQQQCISLLNKDNDELKVIAEQTQKSNGKRKKSKRIKESELMEQISLTIEKQDSINKNYILKASEDPTMNKIASIRKSNLRYSSLYLSDFDSVIITRQKLFDRYKEYSDEMVNHTKQNKQLEEYENLLKENQELNEILAKRNEQKDMLEKKKRKLAKIEKSIAEIELIKEKIENIEQEIEDKKSSPELSQIFQQDGQIMPDTPSQISDTQIYQSIECETDSPHFNSLNEKDLKNLIIKYEKEITDINQRKEYESSEMMKKLQIMKDQYGQISQEISLLMDHFCDMNS